eukprot:m.44676 g.44676  ORF g.44676 m.44676 type:complete len:111 (-) comp5837_c0_seq4:1574-1906(-)
MMISYTPHARVHVSSTETALSYWYSPIEMKVREATDGDDEWGPHGPVMADIAKATCSEQVYHECMEMLWRRILKDREGKFWRRIYKVRGSVCVSRAAPVMTVMIHAELFF